MNMKKGEKKSAAIVNRRQPTWARVSSFLCSVCAAHFEAANCLSQIVNRQASILKTESFWTCLETLAFRVELKSKACRYRLSFDSLSNRLARLNHTIFFFSSSFSSFFQSPPIWRTSVHELVFIAACRKLPFTLDPPHARDPSPSPSWCRR